MNSTVKMLKIFSFVRKRLPKASMVVGWQIANKVKKSRAQHGVFWLFHVKPPRAPARGISFKH
jgi:hypothetical protein